VSQILNFQNVTVVRDGKRILGPITLDISEGQRWVIVGPNGAGKTTLFQIAATNIHPSTGSVEVLGSPLGSTDVFELRPRIGLTTNNLVATIPENEIVLDLVMSSAYAIVGRWNESYDLWDESRAMSLLTTLGVRELKDRVFGTLSEGEKKRVLIARALMPNPELLLLDEPAAGLDLAGREDLLKRLDALAADPLSPATLIVTHHLEEIPHGTTHALLLKSGTIIGAGEISTVLTSENLSLAYDIPITLIFEGGRYFARAL
jgi:iron complex transport system ATP-binding protein